ncbi:MAG TPA: hypothetical protein V6C97_02980 [Oculatellaceae cyanobacterium]
MDFGKRTRKQLRNRKGSIAEFAPAMYFILIVGFFPMLDMIAVMLSYADCQYLHFTLVRQAGLEQCLTLDTTTTPASLKPNYAFVTDPNGTFQSLITGWYNGVGHFTTRSLADITVTANIDVTQGTPTLKYVTINTTVVCNPLVPIPFPYQVPGLSAPVTFSMSGNSVIEYVPS